MASAAVNPEPRLDHDLAEARRFIEALTGDAETPCTFQTFADREADKKNPARRDALARKFHGSLSRVAPQLQRFNRDWAGIFVTVQQTDLRGRREENVIAARALFVDADNGPLGELAVTPSLRVTTAHGEHVYWLLADGEPLDQVKPALKALAKVLGTDPSVAELARVLRVPGFYHMKADPFMVRISELTGVVYTIQEVLEGLDCTLEEPKPKPTPAATTPRQQGPSTPARDRARAWLCKRPGAVEGEGGDAHTYGTACAMVRDFDLPDGDALDLLLEWNQTCLPPWTTEDLEEKIRRARKYGTHPAGAKLDEERPGRAAPGVRSDVTLEPPPDDVPHSAEVGEGLGAALRAEQGKRPDTKQLRAHTQAEALAAFKSRGDLAVVPTGIEGLDACAAGGLPVNAVTVALGYTGTGKTEVARQIGRSVAACGYGVIRGDTEIGLARLAERDLSQDSRIPPRRLRDGRLTAEEARRLREAEARLEADTHILTLCPGTGVPLPTLEGLIIEARARLPGDRPCLVILDSLQRLAAGAEGKDQRLQVQHTMWWAEQFAHSHDVAVLIIGEQKRSQDGKAPSPESALTSGAESRAVEFVADLVLVLVPQSAPEEETAAESEHDFERRVSVIVAKNRQGSTGYLPEDLVFRGPCWEMTTEPRGANELEEKIAEVLEDGEVWTIAKLTKNVRRRKQAVLGALRAMRAHGAVEHVLDENGRPLGWKHGFPNAGTRSLSTEVPETGNQREPVSAWGIEDPCSKSKNGAHTEVPQPGNPREPTRVPDVGPTVSRATLGTPVPEVVL